MTVLAPRPTPPRPSETSDPGRSPCATAGRPRGPRGNGGRWAITLAATAVSTYALDAVATAAGVALAASQLLAGVSHTGLLAILALSYVAWGAGLRVSLAANQALLERTGASTNALSKLAYDVTRRRAPRLRRIATAAGYVATEIAKEVPYYAGAFGAAVVSDSVAADDAIVFLAGANAGAALYEYGLGRLTQTALSRRYASFEDDWVPGEYLADYYSRLEPDEVATIDFFVEAMEHVDRDRPLLLFGTGPTLHHVFLAARVASEIHLADYLHGNLAEIARWLARDPQAHDWRPFVRHTLRCEGNDEPTDEDVTRREELTREKITRLLPADARDEEPLDGDRYATVISAYCADSATSDRATWELLMRNITGLVKPGGTFVTAALRHAGHYAVGGKRFPSASVDEHDLRSVLEPEFDTGRGAIEVREVGAHEALGYSSIVLARAPRSCGYAAS